jgi:hypothetical protein
MKMRGQEPCVEPGDGPARFLICAWVEYLQYFPEHLQYFPAIKEAYGRV